MSVGVSRAVTIGQRRPPHFDVLFFQIVFDAICGFRHQQLVVDRPGGVDQVKTSLAGQLLKALAGGIEL